MRSGARLFPRLRDTVVIFGAGVVLTACPAARAQTDDTYVELNGDADIVITGDRGYENYELMEWEDGTKIDARAAKWDSYMYCSGYHASDCNTTAKNNYPIEIGADWVGAYPDRVDLYNYGNCPDPQTTSLLWFGGVINGTAPLNCSWRQSKGSNGGGFTLNALNSTIDGMRMHNLHDPFIPLEGNGFTLKNCWISYARDDAIENDGFAGGLIDDCLFDGVFVFYSARNTGGGGEQAVAPGSNKVVRVQNCLIRLQNLPGVNYGSGSGWGNCFKEEGGRSPTIEMVNNIWLLEKPNPSLSSSRQSVKPNKLGECRNNTLIWLGSGSYSAPGGFRVIKDKSVWDRARADWIKNHPYVPRVEGDPMEGYIPPEDVSTIDRPAGAAPGDNAVVIPKAVLSDQMLIESARHPLSRVVIADIAGRVVARLKPGGLSAAVPVRAFAPGPYTVRVTAGGRTVARTTAIMN